MRELLVTALRTLGRTLLAALALGCLAMGGLAAAIWFGNWMYSS